MNQTAVIVLSVFLILFLANLCYLGYITFQKYKDVYSVKSESNKGLMLISTPIENPTTSILSENVTASEFGNQYTLFFSFKLNSRGKHPYNIARRGVFGAENMIIQVNETEVLKHEGNVNSGTKKINELTFKFKLDGKTLTIGDLIGHPESPVTQPPNLTNSSNNTLNQNNSEESSSNNQTSNTEDTSENNNEETKGNFTNTFGLSSLNSSEDFDDYNNSLNKLYNQSSDGFKVFEPLSNVYNNDTFSLISNEAFEATNASDNASENASTNISTTDIATHNHNNSTTHIHEHSHNHNHLNNDNNNAQNNQPVYDMCSISNIGLDTTYHIAVTINNNIVEIYESGRLMSSCVLKGMIQPTSEPFEFFFDKGLDGILYKFIYYDKAYNEDVIYNIYRNNI